MSTAIVAFILLAATSPGYPQAADKEALTSIPISRSFIGFTLGDSLEKVKHEYTLEHADMRGLRSGEEAVRPMPTPKETDRIILRFLDGTLYEIAVYYTGGYSSELGWQEFIMAAAQKYGPPQEEGDGSVKWNDEQTSLLLTKSERYRSYDGFGSMVSYFSAVYRDRAMVDEASKRRMAIAPNF